MIALSSVIIRHFICFLLAKFKYILVPDHNWSASQYHSCLVFMSCFYNSERFYFYYVCNFLNKAVYPYQPQSRSSEAFSVTSTLPYLLTLLPSIRLFFCCLSFHFHEKASSTAGARLEILVYVIEGEEVSQSYNSILWLQSIQTLNNT